MCSVCAPMKCTATTLAVLYLLQLEEKGAAVAELLTDSYICEL